MNDSRAWIFQGEGARFASAVFSNRAVAEQWIAQHALNGVLTAYPFDTGGVRVGYSRRLLRAEEAHWSGIRREL